MCNRSRAAAGSTRKCNEKQKPVLVFRRWIKVASELPPPAPSRKGCVGQWPNNQGKQRNEYAPPSIPLLASTVHLYLTPPACNRRSPCLAKGHEGPGSILSYLKRRNWANALGVDASSSTDDFNIYEVSPKADASHDKCCPSARALRK